MEAVHDGSSEFWLVKLSYVRVTRAVAGVDENAACPGKNDVSEFTMLGSLSCVWDGVAWA